MKIEFIWRIVFLFLSLHSRRSLHFNYNDLEVSLNQWFQIYDPEIDWSVSQFGIIFNVHRMIFYCQTSDKLHKFTSSLIDVHIISIPFGRIIFLLSTRSKCAWSNSTKLIVSRLNQSEKVSFVEHEISYKCRLTDQIISLYGTPWKVVCEVPGAGIISVNFTLSLSNFILEIQSIPAQSNHQVLTHAHSIQNSPTLGQSFL